MSRPAAVSADQIRATVLAMLAESGDTNTPAGATGSAEPVTRERFRRAVSVRRLRSRLGAGDPAVLSRALNAIEAELVQAGLTQVALPGLPDAIAETDARAVGRRRQRAARRCGAPENRGP
ncbi:hypothetical protein BZM27_46655 [Paraburkholderia steynii]|uniref:KfrA N-terminal DNA-binding domain-containing protein n=1 Tax=Paraburkholderia steynii TaxID=1245441 RepID=A0A4R0X0X2_9BURK|nr:hypothetical protein BZM27_46655 [Paraburkholderia steynii]